MFIFQQFGIVFRQIRRSTFFSILKIVGLCIGFTVFIVLLSMVRKEISYDDFWTNRGKLYRVALEQHKEGQLQMQSARNYLGIGHSFMYAAILAILVSCLGLLGLSKYNAIRRTREIGIRKTFWASSSSILLLLQSQTIVLILISAVMGIPVAWLITDRWLNTFMYHISAKWWMLFIAVVLTLIVAFVSASILSIRTARANPIESIPYE